MMGRFGRAPSGKKDDAAVARGITQSKFADGRTQSTMASPMKLVNSHQSLITPTFTSSSTHRYFQKRKKENGRHELYQCTSSH
jgi:hypothetical protein